MKTLDDFDKSEVEILKDIYNINISKKKRNKLQPKREHHFNVVPLKNWMPSLYDWISAAILGLTFFVVAFVLIFRVANVVGSSMEPNLFENEKLIIFNTPFVSYDDIVVIVEDGQEGSSIIKRVVAVEGDRVRIDEVSGSVFLNGQKIEDDFSVGVTEPKDFGEEEQTVPEGCYFVLGDNREVSFDSRYSETGFIRKDQIVGKLILRYSPIKKFKFYL